MKPVRLLLVLLLIAPPLANAELVELVTIYGPQGGAGFYHVAGPGDVNQDGYDDFIISSPVRDRGRHECENGYARLYFGGDPIDTSNYITIPAVCDGQDPPDNEFGKYCARVGYFNGDPYPDFLIGDPWYDAYWGPWNSGGGFIYWGGPTIDTLPGLRLIGDSFNALSFFYGLGDINGDSYNDIVASMAWRTKWSDDPYTVDIYLGGESPDNIPDFEIWPFFGQYPVIAEPAKIVGDYNGDGKDDIVFSNEMLELGVSYMFFGSETGFQDPDLVFGTESTGGFGLLFSGCGDLNDDHYDDIAIADWHSTYVYFGSENPDTVADMILVDDEDTLSNVHWLATGGDLNMDGIHDIAMSNPWWGDQYEWQGRVFIYFGGSDMDSIPDIVLTGDSYRQGLGQEMVFPGDLNGDDYPEFIVSSANSNHPGYSFVTIYTTNITSVEGSDPLPLVTELELSCYPNPFNTSTVISYSLPLRTHVKLEVFNLAGRKVASLVDEIQSPGRKSIMWEGLDDRGQPVSSGIYFCKISCNNLTKTERMALLR